jgi:DNA-binding transcriptional LysR family regulator
MPRRLRTPKLTYIQSFCAVAKHGSIAAAVRAEGSSLPTLSRHISALEADLGVTLFDRRGDGLALTQTGVRLFEHAEDVSKAAARFAVAASGQDDQIAGTVRITASRAVANFMLPDILAKLGDAQPSKWSRPTRPRTC